MPHSFLYELGLSPNEAKIYYALLMHGGAEVSAISVHAHIHRRNAYDAIQRLKKKGLIFESFGKNKTVYEAVEPAKLMEFIREKEVKLSQAMPELQKYYKKHRSPELAYIFNGSEGIKNYLREVLNTGKDLYILGAEGAWFDPSTAPYASWFFRELKKKNITIHSLLDHDTRNIPEVDLFTQYPHKFLPAKYNTNATMEIFGDYIVSYTGTSPGKLRDNTTIFVLFSPELSACYRTWWQLIWDLLPEEDTKKKAKKKRSK